MARAESEGILMNKQEVLAKLQKQFDEAVQAQKNYTVGSDIWMMFETKATAYFDAINIVQHLKEVAE